MPRTVNEGFLDFLTKLTPSTYESESAKSHRASILACLRNNYTVYRLARIGSFGNGTSISGHSDVDYIAEVSVNNLTADSTYSMSRLRNTLDARFPRTGVAIRCPAVQVPFGLSIRDSTEIVLAKNTHRNAGTYPIYKIPNCTGGWMDAAPDAHNAYVANADSRLNRKVRPLIRFIKAWKYFRNVPVSSFYLEMRVAQYANSQSTIMYSVDVLLFFDWLINKQMAAIQDPTGASGYIHACRTQRQFDGAWSKLKTASSRAANARTAEAKDQIRVAFDWWRLLYNDAFPSYYR